MLRRLIRHPRTQAMVATLLGAYLALAARTTRWTVLGAENVEAAAGVGGGEAAGAGPRLGFVSAFWHEQLAVMPLGWIHACRRVPALRGARMHVLVSRHRDGRLIGRVAGRFHLSMVHASTRRGGATGLRRLARLLGAGESVAITPDGPRGPRRRAAPGVVHLAALTGRPVLPCGVAMAWVWRLGSWDRMMLPLPFGRGVLLVGPPIRVPREGAEAMLPAIEAALSEAADRAAAIAAGGSEAVPLRAVAA